VEGTGEQARDFIYVGDVCHSIVNSLNYGKPAIFNVGTGKEISINELVEIFRGFFGDLEVEYIPMPKWRKETEGCPYSSKGLPVQETFKKLGLRKFKTIEEGLSCLIY